MNTKKKNAFFSIYTCMNYFRTTNHRTVLIHVHHSLILAKKKKKNQSKTEEKKKNDANKILENNITVKLAITQNKEMGRICLFYLVQVDPLITSYCRYQLAAADFQFTLMQ